MKNKFLFLSLLIPSLGFSQINSKEFINNSQQVIQSTMNNFKKDINQPLEARIFDIGDPMYYNFLSGGTGQRNYKNDHMALVYFNPEHNPLQVNNQNTSYCFILYNSKDTKFISNYLQSTSFNDESLIEYLNYHELGHCFSAFQGQYFPDKKITDNSIEESMADTFAIAMFLNENKSEEALKIIDFNKKIKTDDIHYNPLLLKLFYDNYSKNNTPTTHVKEVFERSYNILSNLATINN